MRHLQYIFLVLTVLSLASCSSDSFKIDGNLVNLDGTAVKVVFRGDSGVVDEWTNLDKKGRFTYEGKASQPSIVTVYNHRGDPLAVMVAVNGDHLKIKGDAGIGKHIKVGGNKVNDDWQLFRDEHAAFYSDPNPSRLDAAIGKYVREHPSDLLSTVLLVVDYSNYSDRAAVDKLLSSIDIKVRPESLTSSLTKTPSGRKSNNLPRLMILTLLKHDGGFEEIKFTGKTSLINLWANPQENRKAVNDKLNKLDQDVTIIDVLTESDTLRWHKTIEGEPWKHYWAPGGPLEPGIQLLGINSMPWYAVIDATGLVAYSGPNLDTAINTAMTQAAPEGK